MYKGCLLLAFLARFFLSTVVELSFQMTQSRHLVNVRRTSFDVMMVAALISVDIVTKHVTVQMAPMNMTVVRNNTCNVVFLCLCTLISN